MPRKYTIEDESKHWGYEGFERCLCARLAEPLLGEEDYEPDQTSEMQAKVYAVAQQIIAAERLPADTLVDWSVYGEEVWLRFNGSTPHDAEYPRSGTIE